MAGQDITVGMTIGDSLTGTLRASSVIQAPTNGNIIDNIDALVSAATLATYNSDHSVSLTAIPVHGAVALLDLQAIGFVATLVTAGTGANTVVVTLVGAAAGGMGDVTFNLIPASGQPNGVAFSNAAAAGILHNITSVTITPDSTAVIEVQGKIYTKTT